MILVDANLLLYAKFSGFSQHRAAHAWLMQKLNAPARVALPWPSLLGFLRIATNPRAFGKPLSTRAAWQQISEWLAQGNVWTPLPGDRHAEVLGMLLAATSASANLIPDAHLAALAIEHGLVLCSCDGDFARFPTLRWEDPI